MWKLESVMVSQTHYPFGVGGGEQALLEASFGSALANNCTVLLADRTTDYSLFPFPFSFCKNDDVVGG